MNIYVFETHFASGRVASHTIEATDITVAMILHADMLKRRYNVDQATRVTGALRNA